MRKIIEHTYGSSIYMKLELEGKIYEVQNHAGVDGSWEHFTTSADGTPEREKVIAAFKKLY